MLLQMFEPSAPASHLTGGLEGPPGGHPPGGAVGHRLVAAWGDILILRCPHSLVRAACCLLFASELCRFSCCPLRCSAMLDAVSVCCPMLTHAHAVGLTSSSVAVRVFRASPSKPVISVSEVPCFASTYRHATSAAEHGMAFGQVPGPSDPLGLMPCVVASTRSRATLPLVGLPVSLAIALSSRHKLRAVVPCAPAQQHGCLLPGRGDG